MPTTVEVNTAATNFISDTTTADSKINGAAGTVVDRHGTTTKNLEQIFEDVGYDVPVAFTSGLNPTTGAFTVDYLGNIYAAKPSVVPFTTTGSFVANEWVLIAGYTDFLDKDTLFSDATVSYPNGTILRTRKEGFSYIVLDPSTPIVSGYPLVQSGGVKLGVYANRDGSYDPLAFDATLDGVTDDTAAFMAACVVAAADTGIVVVNGDMAFDPTFLASISLTHTLTIEVTGTLIPSTTIAYSGTINFKGRGGVDNIQFGSTPVAQITGVSGAPTISITGSGRDRVIENIVIPTSNNVGIQTTGAANIILRNVGISTDGTAGSVPVRADNSFWVWMERCSFKQDTSAAAADRQTIHLTKNTAGSYIGLIKVTDTRLNNYGVLIDSPVATSGALNGPFLFKDCDYENGVNEFLRLDATNTGTYQIELDRVLVADPVSVPRLMTVTAPEGVHRVVLKDCLYRPMLNDVNIDQLVIDGGEDSTNIDPIGTTRYNGLHHIGHTIYGQLDTVPGEFSGTVTPGNPIAVPQDPSTWPSGGGSATVTTGIRAPDGTLTAATLSSAAGVLESRIMDTALAFGIGDWIIAGMYLLNEGDFLDAPFITTVGGTILSPDGSSSNGGFIRPEHAGFLGEGWMNVNAPFKVTSVSTNFRFTLRCRLGSYITYWKPWAFSIAASAGMSDMEVYRLCRQTRGIVSDAAKGVVALHTHQTHRTGSGATGARPASTPAGAQWFDTTLGKPIWSNGAGGWTDAAGGAV